MGRPWYDISTPHHITSTNHQLTDQPTDTFLNKTSLFLQVIHIHAHANARSSSHFVSGPTFPRRQNNKQQQDAIKILTQLASKSGAPIHVAHVSDADSLGMVKAARDAGKRITAETCTHYLMFAAEDIPDGNTLYKCAPPIREGKNRDKLWKVRFVIPCSGSYKYSTYHSL